MKVRELLGNRLGEAVSPESRRLKVPESLRSSNDRLPGGGLRPLGRDSQLVRLVLGGSSLLAGTSPPGGEIPRSMASGSLVCRAVRQLIR